MTVLSEETAFWWVWTKHGRRPTRFHKSAKSAEREAKRLARQFPEWKFIVLHAYAKYGSEEARRLTNEAREARKLRAASADTHPKGQDAQQGLAGTESGAVPRADEADAQDGAP